MSLEQILVCVSLWWALQCDSIKNVHAQTTAEQNNIVIFWKFEGRWIRTLSTDVV